ncbi:GNAT family N-acetyltransferase [Enterococcus rivorum]|uniref:GNAT family N-acetyltransferase n=1 Tax=Enterococcus rivorum TaxID=762845 RepID=A0A1E5KWK4_9ENTE|nr:GNAT family N-acetyltransferase [Enterococcus rivorum]OEH82253.1 GNAT family N-acetyltransferase [Enterococcus rivorum]
MTGAKWRFFQTKNIESEPPIQKKNPLKKIKVSAKIRLVPFDRTRREAFRWYQDPDSMYYIVGAPSIYTKKQIRQMYHWQNENGLLYYIEYNVGEQFRTIGDVWLSEDDYAIVIDKRFRNKGIGRSVTKYFIYKAQKMERKYIYVSEVFTWNSASQKMFTSLGFYPYEKQKDAWSYRKRLNSGLLSK